MERSFCKLYFHASIWRGRRLLLLRPHNFRQQFFDIGPIYWLKSVLIGPLMESFAVTPWRASLNSKYFFAFAYSSIPVNTTISHNHLISTSSQNCSLNSRLCSAAMSLRPLLLSCVIKTAPRNSVKDLLTHWHDLSQYNASRSGHSTIFSEIVSAYKWCCLRQGQFFFQLPNDTRLRHISSIVSSLVRISGVFLKYTDSIAFSVLVWLQVQTSPWMKNTEDWWCDAHPKITPWAWVRYNRRSVWELCGGNGMAGYRQAMLQFKSAPRGCQRTLSRISTSQPLSSGW